MDDANDLIQYLTETMPAAAVECAGCGVKRKAARAVQRDDNFYCSEECADRSCAVLRKQQPKRNDCDGWSI